MRLVTTRDAARLTGLSTEQLREWTIRRALIPPDIKPKGHGSPAQFSWQTILLLRLAVVLRDRFKIELQAHIDLFAQMSTSLAGISFLSLWGKSLALYGGGKWEVIDSQTDSVFIADCIVLRLDDHLQQLSESFSLPQPVNVSQFQLFPAWGLITDDDVKGTTGRRKHG